MAYTPGNLVQMAQGNGYGLYRYDTTDDLDVVEDAGYFNNKDDELNLGVGDIIHAFSWNTAVRTGTLAAYKTFAVSNVVSIDAASSAGAVNVAEIGVSTAGAISSGD